MEENTFSPMFSGCITENRAMARELERLYGEELEEISTYLYHSIRYSEEEAEFSTLLDDICADAVREIRFLGRIILSLGGRCRISARMECGGDVHLPEVRNFCARAARKEKKQLVRVRYLTENTDDPVLCVLLQSLAQIHQTRAEILEGFFCN